MVRMTIITIDIRY